MSDGEKGFVWICGISVIGVMLLIAFIMYLEHCEFREAIEAGLHQQYIPGSVNPIWVPKEAQE